MQYERDEAQALVSKKEAWLERLLARKMWIISFSGRSSPFEKQSMKKATVIGRVYSSFKAFIALIYSRPTMFREEKPIC